MIIIGKSLGSYKSGKEGLGLVSIHNRCVTLYGDLRL